VHRSKALWKTIRTPILCILFSFFLLSLSPFSLISRFNRPFELWDRVETRQPWRSHIFRWGCNQLGKFVFLCHLVATVSSTVAIVDGTNKVNLAHTFDQPPPFSSLI
jgi:hypothetical protein